MGFRAGGESFLAVKSVKVGQVLTRSSGYLRPVCSHSLNPYVGCSLGKSLCGVACYVQHNVFVTRGRPWGSFFEARVNAAETYRRDYARERSWAGHMSIFMASATDPFPPQEASLGISRSILEAMLELPPDRLILQTHSALVASYLELLEKLSQVCDLRIHLSIECDRERIPGLPPPAYSVERRMHAARNLKQRGLSVTATLSPLLPLRDPASFFGRLQDCVDAVVVDHFIGGDGSPHGSRTRRTPLPEIMEQIQPGSSTLAYRDQVVEWARKYFPGRVGVGQAGFAGCYA